METNSTTKTFLPRAVWRACLLASAAALAGCGNTNHTSLAVTGTIEGTTIGVGSRVGGRISEISVKEGDNVAEGQVLVKLECGEQEAALAAAQAKLAQATATSDRLQNGARPEELDQAKAAADAAEAQYQMAVNGARTEDVKAARALADAAKTQADLARTEFDRAKKLYDGHAASKQIYDQASHGLDAADSQYKAAKEKLDLLVNGTRNEQIQMAKADRDRAKAAYELLKNGARKEDLDAALARWLPADD